MIRSEQQAWRADAACLGTETALFFPSEKADDPDGRMTKSVYPRWMREMCRGCPVQTECLEEALVTTSTSGMWAATSTRQRAAIRKQRAA